MSSSSSSRCLCEKNSTALDQKYLDCKLSSFLAELTARRSSQGISDSQVESAVRCSLEEGRPSSLIFVETVLFQKHPRQTDSGFEGVSLSVDEGLSRSGALRSRLRQCLKPCFLIPRPVPLDDTSNDLLHLAELSCFQWAWHPPPVDSLLDAVVSEQSAISDTAEEVCSTADSELNI